MIPQIPFEQTTTSFTARGSPVSQELNNIAGW